MNVEGIEDFFTIKILSFKGNYEHGIYLPSLIYVYASGTYKGNLFVVMKNTIIFSLIFFDLLFFSTYPILQEVELKTTTIVLKILEGRTSLY